MQDYEEFYEKVVKICKQNAVVKRKIVSIQNYDRTIDTSEIIGYLINRLHNVKNDDNYLYTCIQNGLNDLFNIKKKEYEISIDIRKYYNFLSNRFRMNNCVVDIFIYTMDKRTLKKLNLDFVKDLKNTWVDTKRLNIYYKEFVRYLKLDIEPTKEGIKKYLTEIYEKEKWNEVEFKEYSLKDWDIEMDS